MSSTAKVAPQFVLSPSAVKLRLLKKLRCTLRYEKNAWASGAVMVAGVDEVGRGSLFGPVVAAAVILERGYRVRGLRDSKLLLPERRELLAPRIREHAVAWSVAAVDAARIDQINIYQASRLAMREAVMRLAPAADHLLIDAMRLDCELPQRAIIHGDALSASIAAASIQSGARPHDARMGCGFPRIWAGFAQGLQHAATSGSFGEIWSDAAASSVIRSRVEQSGRAGSFRVRVAGGAFRSLDTCVCSERSRLRHRSEKRKPPAVIHSGYFRGWYGTEEPFTN
jgi:hypothetical protein